MGKTEGSRGGYRALIALPVPRRLAIMALPADFADWVDYAAIAALLVFTWGEGPFVMAAFVIALGLPYIAVGPFLAVLVDRTPLRTVLVASNIGRSLTTIGLVFAGETAVLLALVLVRSSVDSAFNPARQAAIQATTPPHLLAAANGLHHAINQTSKIAGPAIGGAMLAVVSAQAVLGFNALLSAIAAVIAATIRIERRDGERDDGPASFFARAAVGFGEFARNRLLRLALIFSVTAFFAIFLYDALIPLLTQGLGFDETVFGFAMATSGLGGLIGALAAGRITQPRPLILMAGGAIAGGLITILLGIAALAGWAVALFAFLATTAAMSVAFGFQTVPYRTAIQATTPPDRIARVVAAGESITILVMLAAPIAGAAVARWLGTGAAFVAGGGVLLVLGAVTIASRWSRQRIETSNPAPR